MSPGQPDSVQPESSINYETGGRINTDSTSVEVVGYFNNYKNLTSECTLSSGCDDSILNRQFNAGKVFAYGLETVASHTLQDLWGIDWTAKAVYTLTLSDFRTNFVSGNPQFGSVTRGDELPYVPKHQGSIVISANTDRWSGNLSAAYTGAQRDIAGQGDIPQNEKVPSYAIFDATINYSLNGHTRVYMAINNLLNKKYVVSRRPFGLRPGRPLQMIVGIKHQVGR